MTPIEQYKKMENATVFERTSFLMDMLHNAGVDKADYINFLNGDTSEEVFLSSFNVIKFLAYVGERDMLDDGFYWVKDEPGSEWVVAQMVDGYFRFCGEMGEVAYNDVARIHLNPILPPEEEH